MFGLGTTELLVIGVIVFLIFGAKRIPEIGKGLGGAIREFKQIKKDINTKEEDEDVKESTGDQEQKDPPALEKKIAEKVIEQVPGVRNVMAVKRKVERVKKFIE